MFDKEKADVVFEKSRILSVNAEYSVCMVPAQNRVTYSQTSWFASVNWYNGFYVEIARFKDRKLVFSTVTNLKEIK